MGLLSTLEVEPNELFDITTSRDENELKETLINAIQGNKVDVNLLYRIYRSIKY